MLPVTWFKLHLKEETRRFGNETTTTQPFHINYILLFRFSTIYIIFLECMGYNNECINFFLYTLYNANHILVDYRGFIWLFEGIYLTHIKMLHMLLLWSSIMLLFFFLVTVRRPSVKPSVTAQNKFTTPLWYMNMDNTVVYTFSQDGVQWNIIYK